MKVEVYVRGSHAVTSAVHGRSGLLSKYGVLLVFLTGPRQNSAMTHPYRALLALIEQWATELGFDAVGIAAANLDQEAPRLTQWLAANYHGDMDWLAERKALRLSPELLHPGTTRVISLRMNYLPENTEQIKTLKSPEKAYVSRYALGRDYHKLMRKRLAQLADRIQAYCVENALHSGISQRPFVDSAPVMERPLAAKAGLGWIGKHTLLLHPQAGSWFFLGEIYTNIPLPTNTESQKDQCGDCQACLQVCPTDAFPQPYVLDARRCISYLTIENKGPIPEEFREVMGNRVFGCDDCQAICPWNKYAQHGTETDFQPRHQLQNSDLLTLFNWTEQEFLDNTAGSPIRRIGYVNWLRNLAVGLGNAPSSDAIMNALEARVASFKGHWMEEQLQWALMRQRQPPKVRKRKLKVQDRKS